ncbi:MAG TPA: RraA family protein [Polyangiaceae bacterium]|jgi:regulator of RNase E activity RraA
MQLKKWFDPLRVVDVCDAMDGMGYFNIGLVDRRIRPLWSGMKFWGIALTVRCVTANRPMWRLGSTEEIVNAHGIWFERMGNIGFHELVKPGHVIVTDTGASPEVGFWGSANSLGTVHAGAVGIVTSGYCRDTAEIALQRTPICARARGRTIIPGRIEVAEVQGKIDCGGAQVRPGDVVGADDDGVVVVPAEIAEEVSVHARAVLLADMRARRGLYQKLGMPFDSTVDYESVEAHYRSLS